MTKLVFVIGAGASSEFDLPTGEVLKHRIAETLRTSNGEFSTFSDRLFQASARRFFSDRAIEADFFEAANLIRRNMGAAPSIDNFVDTHRQWPMVAIVAKLAISKCILDAEGASKLFVQQDNIYNEIDLASVSNTWLGQLFKALTQQRDFEGFLDRLSNITFISFNYDRCIHQFFWFASRTYFNLTDEKALRVIAHLNVEYPYGTIGPLQYNDSNRTGFGKVDQTQIVNGAANLRTFTEGCEESGFPDKAKAAFSSASSVYFLGFGFLPLNMSILLDGSPYQVEGMYGTSKGLPAQQVQEVLEELRPHFVRRIYDNGGRSELEGRLRLLHITASELVWEHSRALSR